MPYLSLPTFPVDPYPLVLLVPPSADTVHFIHPIMCFIFFGGARREMCHALVTPEAPCEGLQYVLPLSLIARWTVCHLIYPLKLLEYRTHGHLASG